MKPNLRHSKLFVLLGLERAALDDASPMTGPALAGGTPQPMIWTLSMVDNQPVGSLATINFGESDRANGAAR